MRIVVNDIAASTGGAMTILRDFYNYVCANDAENEWIFLLGEKYFQETENVKIIAMPKIKKSSVKKLLFDFFTGKSFIKDLNPDMVFSMQNIITFGLKVPQIVYLHQSIPFQKIKKFSFLKKSERKLAVYQYIIGSIIKLSAKKCDRLVVQTDWMKEAVCKQCHLSSEKVVKISPHINNVTNEKCVNQFSNNHFFYPTSVAIYKNNSAIFEASKILNNKGLDFEVILTIPEKYSTKSVSCVGRLPYETVIENYTKGTLIFPSYIETFGIPMAEARQLGTIVLASDCPFSREVLNNYENAHFFDPFNPQELAELMERIIKGDIVRRDSEAMSASCENGWLEVLKTVTRG